MRKRGVPRGSPALVAQGIEQWFPKPCTQVRILPGAPTGEALREGGGTRVVAEIDHGAVRFMDEGEGQVSSADIDRYLREVPARQRVILQRLRETIMEIVPEAEQCISYKVPAFRVTGGVVCGFASFKNHMSYLPFSGSVLGQLSDELDAFTCSKSALRFTPSTPLPDPLVERLIQVRLAEIRARKR